MRERLKTLLTEKPVPQIIKRDNRRVDFEAMNIFKAVRSAFKELGYNKKEETIESITAAVLDGIAENYNTENLPSVEKIQDIVEQKIILFDFPDVLDSYKSYRKDRTRKRQERRGQFRESLLSVKPVAFIVKRNQEKVEFESKKIFKAINAAFVSCEYENEDKVIEDIVNDVLRDIGLAYSEKSPPNVEQIQDIVEQKIKHFNFPDVLSSYKNYRKEHAKKRQEQILEKIYNKELSVIDEDGESFFFHEHAMLSRLSRLAGGLPHVNVSQVMDSTLRGLYDGIHFAEIEHLALKEIEYKMEEHYEYGFFAARLILDSLYKDILGCSAASDSWEEQYCEQFKEYIHFGIEEDMLSEELKNFDIEKICRKINGHRDKKFSYMGIKTLSDRYLLKTRSRHASEKRIFELPQWLWMRVAMGLCIYEDKENREDKAIEFYNALSNLYLLSSTPTLFNGGTKSTQLSSCYINIVGDSLDAIFKSYSDEAQLSKWAGGIGTDWTGVRASGAAIKGTNGESSGIIPFIKIYNDIAIAVNQGGKRRGAMAAYLENWHLDVEEFLELRKNTGDERRRTHDIHPALFISDLFMKRVLAKEPWSLFSPSDAPLLHLSYGAEFEEHYLAYEKDPKVYKKTVDAVSLWQKGLTMLYETGHPWITFKDAINLRSPQSHVGMVHSSNLCTEITLNTSEDETAVCNLASINLSNMVDEKNGCIDEKLLKQSVRTAINMLDNVIDINFYPTKEAENANKLHRPVGLGLMGYHDALFKLRIPYSSEAQVTFADRTMEKISYYAISASSDIAKKRGSYSSFKGSKWDKGILPIDSIDILEQQRGQKVEVDRETTMDWEALRNKIKRQGLRNSNMMAIAPTATIANIAGVTPCVEPIYKNIYSKSNLSGNFNVINRYLMERLLEKGLWNKDIRDMIKERNGSVDGVVEISQDIKDEFKDIFDIDQRWIIRAAAKRSKWIDQSASTNIFLKTRIGEEVSALYIYAWKMGLKTTYYLRSLASSQVTKTSNFDPEKAFRQNLSAQAESKSCLLSDPDCEACQ